MPVIDIQSVAAGAVRVSCDVEMHGRRVPDERDILRERGADAQQKRQEKKPSQDQLPVCIKLIRGFYSLFSWYQTTGLLNPVADPKIVRTAPPMSPCSRANQ